MIKKAQRRRRTTAQCNKKEKGTIRKYLTKQITLRDHLDHLGDEIMVDRKRKVEDLVIMEKDMVSVEKRLKIMTEDDPDRPGIGPKSRTWTDPVVGNVWNGTRTPEGFEETVYFGKTQ